MKWGPNTQKSNTYVHTRALILTWQVDVAVHLYLAVGAREAGCAVARVGSLPRVVARPAILARGVVRAEVQVWKKETCFLVLKTKGRF